MPFLPLRMMVEKMTFLSRIIPNTLLGRVLLFFQLPTLLLFCTLWAALNQLCALTPYFCGILLFGTVASIKYRIKGVLLSSLLLLSLLAFFYKDLSPQERLWQLGICSSTILNFFILFLAAQEIEEGILHKIEESKSYMNQYLAKNQELIELEQSWSKAKLSLEEEIEQWKVEAEQRKLEMRTVEEKMRLVNSEIEMLTSQKESILAEVERARSSKSNSSDTAQIEGLYKQLRSQFEEKSKVLIQTRKELFQTQGKLQELEIANKLKEEAFEREEADHLEKNLAALCQECEEMEEEIRLLEALITHLLGE